MIDTARHTNPLAFLAAFATGGLLSLMIHFNGELARYGSALFSSWIAHATGTVAAVLLLVVLRRNKPDGNGLSHAPLWTYFGGVSGALTVMLASTAVNSPVGLSGTLALGLAGQVIFSLVADICGLFGLPKRLPDARDLVSLGLILTGSIVLILANRVVA